jgi:hypothetical protein
MQVDRSPFLVNKLELENPAVLIRPKQDDTTKGKNVVIGDPRPENNVRPITVTIRGSMTGKHERKVEGQHCG